MPKVRMLETKPGSPDGMNMVTYKQGEVYTLPDDLYRCFNDMGIIERVNEKPVSTPENKAIKGAPENKSQKKSDDEKVSDAV